MSRRWIRLDAEWEESGWLNAISGHASGCWPRLLSWVKLRGKKGRVKEPARSVLADRWKVPIETVNELLDAAIREGAGGDGGVRIEDGQLVIVNWATYNPDDPKAAKRKRDQREREREAERHAMSQGGHAESRRDNPDEHTSKSQEVTPGHAVTLSRDHRRLTEDVAKTATATTRPASPSADSVEVEQVTTAESGPTPSPLADTPPQEPKRHHFERPTYTQSELAKLAAERLGLSRLTYGERGANYAILTDWLHSSAESGVKRDPLEIALAIEGAADMRDRDLIGWDSAKPGMPMTLRALVHAATLADQGDGRAVRTLYDVAVEHQRKREAEPRRAPTTRANGNAMQRVDVRVPA